MDQLDYDRRLIHEHIVSIYPPGPVRDAWLSWLDAVVAWNRGGFVGPMPEAPVRRAVYPVPSPGCL